MQEVITEIEAKSKKDNLPDVRSGDSVKVHQKIWEGKKERVQVFEGTVIRTKRSKSLTANITVRRITSGIGIEKTYFLHSPNVVRVEIVKRSRVRRNYLTYLRKRQGKATRLASREFDKETANKQSTPKTKEEEEQIAAKEAPKAKQVAKSAKTTEAKKTKPEVVKKEAKAEAEPVISKAEAKKAKAEAFRKAQEAKK